MQQNWSENALWRLQKIHETALIVNVFKSKKNWRVPH